jgi:hypothetical protein
MKDFNTFTLFTFIVLFYMSCNAMSKLSSSNSTPEETWALLQDRMALGAGASNERPMPGILSEREVLLKAVDYAAQIGALDPSYYAYQENPALLTAKIETPILLHFPDGTPVSYYLTAVTDNGESLMGVFVRPGVDIKYEVFETGRGSSIPDGPDYLSGHLITKQEVIELIKSQFPDSVIDGPIAVSNLFLEGQPHSNNAIFWYFTVSGDNRSVETSAEEYIIDSAIRGWRTISGGVSNRSAISAGQGGSWVLGGARMAKLETPLRILEKTEEANARTVGGISSPAPYNEPVQFTPVPLR